MSTGGFWKIVAFSASSWKMGHSMSSPHNITLSSLENEMSNYWICIQVPYRNYSITQWYLTCAGDCGNSHIWSVNLMHSKTENQIWHEAGDGWFHYYEDWHMIQLQKFTVGKWSDSSFNTNDSQAFCGSPCGQFWNASLLCKVSEEFFSENGEVL